ncbi:MAG: hypothetical protein ACJA1L_002477 [Paracoccaceae bacterium]|jgi:hypothetical protein
MVVLTEPISPARRGLERAAGDRVGEQIGVSAVTGHIDDPIGACAPKRRNIRGGAHAARKAPADTCER